MDENRVYRAPTARPYAGRQFTNVGLEQLRHALCTFATERAWTQHHTPRNLLLSLVKEVGRLQDPGWQCLCSILSQAEHKLQLPYCSTIAVLMAAGIACPVAASVVLR
jgi:hypothetical protein